jgi:hypothetical protein
MPPSLECVGLRWSKPFTKNGSLHRWRIFQDGAGSKWKQLYYYHRKAERWIQTNKIVRFRGDV